ncbi:MAG: nucleoside-diphosphate kinase [Candidatus Methanofastidiosa archaeon]|nr:nucleoside-diphosphate kinase [Candidatus Methanofastidiosa archaeon]
MIEKSFILLKPDAMENDQIQQHIYNSLKACNLSIKSKKEIVLKEEDVTALWEFTIRDPVCKKILQLYLTNKALQLILIEGENALSKVCKIKSETRKIYAKTFFANCLHAPKSDQEYTRDIYFIFEGKRRELKPILIYDTSKFSKFSKLKKEDFHKCANEIYMITEKNDFLIPAVKKVLSDERHLLYLHNDKIHELVYVAAAIYEFIPKLTLSEAYLICICVEIKGKALLMCSDNKGSLEEIYNLLLETGITVSLAENEGQLRS